MFKATDGLIIDETLEIKQDLKVKVINGYKVDSVVKYVWYKETVYSRIVKVVPKIVDDVIKLSYAMENGNLVNHTDIKTVEREGK